MKFMKRFIRKHLIQAGAGLTTVMFIMGGAASPVMASEAYVQSKMAEVETGASIGSIGDAGNEHNYIQPAVSGGFLTLNLVNEPSEGVLTATYSRHSSALEEEWHHLITVDSQVDARPGKGILREMKNGKVLLLLDYIKPNGKRELRAVRMSADGEGEWSQSLALNTEQLGNVNTKIGLEPLSDRGFLVSFQDDSSHTFTVYKYNAMGEQLWHKQMEGIASGWLIGKGEGYYAILNSSQGALGVQADVYGNDVGTIPLQLGEGKKITQVLKLSNGEIAVTGSNNDMKCTIILGDGLTKISQTDDYTADLVYSPEDQMFVRVRDQYDTLGGQVKIHGITITGMDASGHSQWETTTHYREDAGFTVRYNTGLVYTIPAGYALVSATSGSGQPVVLDFIKILISD